MDPMRYYDDKYGTTYRLSNDWIESWIDGVPLEFINDMELSILRKIENKRTVILNDDEVSYICEPILRSNYEYHMELIGIELSKKVKTEEDKEILIDLIEETKEILDNMKVFDYSSGYSYARDFMEIEEAAKKLLSGSGLTREEEEYYQPDIVKDIKRVGDELEVLKLLKTRMPAQLEQIKKKQDELLRSIKYCYNLYPEWEQLDYYRKLVLDDQVYISNLLRWFKRYKRS
jgi:hypothetical protein